MEGAIPSCKGPLWCYILYPLSAPQKQTWSLISLSISCAFRWFETLPPAREPPTCNTPTGHWDCSTTRTLQWGCTTIRASWRWRWAMGLLSTRILSYPWNCRTIGALWTNIPHSRRVTAGQPTNHHSLTGKALEVDQFGVPYCGKNFNPQTTTSLSPRWTPVTNSEHVYRTCPIDLPIVYSLYIPSVFTLLTAVYPETVHQLFFLFALLKLCVLQLYQSYFLIQETHYTSYLVVTYFSVFKLWFTLRVSASAVAPESPIEFHPRLWKWVDSVLCWWGFMLISIEYGDKIPQHNTSTKSVKFIYGGATGQFGLGPQC